jgi:hypothetical protein
MSRESQHLEDSMKRAKVFATVIFGLLVLAQMGFIVGPRTHAEQLKAENLPAAVQKTIAEQSKGSTVRGISTEREKGQALYELELTFNGRGKDLLIDKQGNIVETEEEVTLSSVPPAVKDGLMTIAGSGTIGKIESITKNGKIVAYEAIVKMGTRNHEVQVGPDGHKLVHPE